jgi:hypothetical protein
MAGALNGPVAAPPKREVPTDLRKVLAMCMAAPHYSVDRQKCIEEFAYSMAERRGFAPGHELDDWLKAETKVDARLAGEGCIY